jgi:hypothetical protein
LEHFATESAMRMDRGSARFALLRDMLNLLLI